MITNTGKSIMAKYLVGQAPAYASHIAIGCGAKPLKGLEFAIVNREKNATVATLKSVNHGLSIGQAIDVVGLGSEFDGTFVITSVEPDTFSYTTETGSVDLLSQDALSGYAYPNYNNKERLDFEMLRVPIISRGYVTEDDPDVLDEFGNIKKISKIVLTAELPTAERYEISEIGVFSGLSNPLAANSDSRSVYSFAANEGWSYHSATDNTVTAIPAISGKLDQDGNTNSISDAAITVPGSNPAVKYKVFQAPASNEIFLSDYRTKRFEQPRFQDNAIFMAGNSANLAVDSFGKMSVVPTWTDGTEFKSNHIHLTNARLNFDRNSVTDELKLAFSVVSRDEDPTNDDVPTSVRLMVEFTSTDAYGEGQYARMEVDLYNSDVLSEDLPNEGYRSNVVIDDLSKNRYFVATRKIEQLTKSSGFSWELVKNVKVYASVMDANNEPTDLFYVVLDGLRFENVSTTNPVYGMTGYTVVNNNDFNQPRTIIKSPNSTNYVEFRFAVDV
jgi:hypothetical protein